MSGRNLLIAVFQAVAEKHASTETFEFYADKCRQFSNELCKIEKELEWLTTDDVLRVFYYMERANIEGKNLNPETNTTVTSEKQ